MSRAERFRFFLNYFTENFPEAETELHYSNPYELIVAVVLSAQCTDKRVNQVMPALLAEFPTAAHLGAATAEDVYPFIKSVSYPNNKAKHLAGLGRMLTEDFGGEVPSQLDELQRLPGVGRKTANVVMSVIYNQPAMAVDTHVFRVSRRLGLVPQTATTPPGRRESAGAPHPRSPHSPRSPLADSARPVYLPGTVAQVRNLPTHKYLRLLC